MITERDIKKISKFIKQKQMIKQLINFISILNSNQRSKFYWYLFSVVLIGIIEITGLVTIIPLVNIYF